MENMVFFGENGLTSTSANHIANVAKEYYQQLENTLDNIRFYKTTVDLLGYNAPALVANGVDTVENIPQMIEDIYQCKALIAWLREAIKAKDEHIKTIKNYSVKEYANLNGITLLNKPIGRPYRCEQDYLETLSIKERFNYINLETELAVLGQSIHPSGYISTAKQQLEHKINNPLETTGGGRDTVVYTHTPTIELSKVDALFFKLQKEHREKQARLNTLKQQCKDWIEAENLIIDNEYKAELLKYNNQQSEVHHALSMWVKETLAEVSKWKIVLPDSLKTIYSKINSLGK